MKYPEFREIVAKPEATISTQDRQIRYRQHQPARRPQLRLRLRAGDRRQDGHLPPGRGLPGGLGRERRRVLHRRDPRRRRGPPTLRRSHNGARVRLRRVRERAPRVNRETSSPTSQLPYRRDETVKLVAAKDVSALAGPGLEVERRATHEEAPPSAKAGRKLGTVEVSVEGRNAGTSPLVVQEGYEAASLWQKTNYWAGGLKRWVLQR